MENKSKEIIEKAEAELIRQLEYLEKFALDANYANTVSNTIPVLLDVLSRYGMIQK